MSWLTSSGKEIQIGEDAAKALKAVVEKLHEQAPESAVLDILDQLIDATSDSKQRSLAVALQFLGAGAIGDLLVTANDLRQRVDNNNDGKLGWGAKKWSKTIQKSPSDTNAISLGVEAEGDAFFEVLSESEQASFDTTVDQANSALSQLVFVGKIGGQAGLKSSARTVSGSFSVEGNFQRGYKLLTLHGLSSPEPIGLGLARSLARVSNPASLTQVSNALTPLGAYNPVAVQFSGGRGIGTDAEITASIIPTAGVAFQVKVGAKLQFGNAFQFQMERDVRPDWIQATLSSKTSSSRGGELGLGVKVGLSGFGINDVSKVLKAISQTGELIDDLDGQVSSVRSWLKPGEILKGELEKAISKLLNTTSNSGDADKRKAIVSWRAFAALLGFEKSGQTKTEAQKEIASSIADHIVEIVDDKVELFSGGQDALEQAILEQLTGRISKQALAYLQSDVLDTVLPNLWGALGELSSQIDSSLHESITKALGTPPEEKLDDIASYLDKARSLLSASAAAIEKASTDLLSAELQAWLSVSQENKIDLSASFLASSTHAQGLYKTFILNPERGISDIRADGSDDVELNTGWRIIDKVREEEGVRWSLALLDFSLASTVKTITDVTVIETESGIAAASKAESIRETSFRNETRSLSFISASRIYFSRDDASAALNNPPPEAFGPLAAPTIDLSFAHADGRLKPDEAEQLLEAFVSNGLLAASAAQKAVEEVRERSTEIGKSSISGSLGIGLAIPSEQVIMLLQRAAQNQSRVLEATSQALARIDPESIIETYSGLRTTKTGLADFANDPSEEILAGALHSVLGDRAPKLSDRPALALEILNNLDALQAYAETSLRRIPLSALGAKNSFMSNLGELKKAKNAIFQSLSLGQSIYQIDFSGMSYGQVRSELKARQRMINDSLKPFFKTGFPLWDVIDWLPGLKERSPGRLVTLFAALLDLSSQFLDGYQPPIRLVVTPENEPSILIQGS